MHVRDTYLALGLSLALASAAGPSAAETGEPFNASLTPPTTVALIDQLVDISLEVDSTATSFNGYTITITYDPSIVSFEGVVEGPLMDASCPQSFEDTDTGPDSVTYTDIILCGGVSVEGPGILSIFSFRTLALGQTTLEITSSPNCTFFDAGTCVGEGNPTCPRPVVLNDAVILVQEEISGIPDAVSLPVTALSLAPNPTRTGGTFAFRLGGTGRVTLELYDASGRRRLLHALEHGTNDVIQWDGRDSRGRAFAPGVYFARVRRGALDATSRVVVAP